MLDLLWMGRLTVIPLGFASVLVLAIVFERAWRYRGIESQTRTLTRESVDLLVQRDVDGARTLCEGSGTPISGVYLEAMRWRNIALEDLEGVLATSRQEVAHDLKRGLWIIGTIGSLAPYIGLFGTVVGIMRAFREIGVTGDTGFEVVSAGIAEALIATAVGLLVAIVALALFNWLQVRLTSIGATYSRSAERFVQALLYAESASTGGDSGNTTEMPSGDLSPA